MKQRTARRAQVFKLATQLGCKVFDVSDDVVVGLEVEAPHRKVFRCNLCHLVATVVYRGRGASAMVYGATLRDLEDGLEDCTEPDCEWCVEHAEQPN